MLLLEAKYLRVDARIIKHLWSICLATKLPTSLKRMIKIYDVISAIL